MDAFDDIFQFVFASRAICPVCWSTLRSASMRLRKSAQAELRCLDSIWHILNSFLEFSLPSPAAFVAGDHSGYFLEMGAMYFRPPREHRVVPFCKMSGALLQRLHDESRRFFMFILAHIHDVPSLDAFFSTGKMVGLGRGGCKAWFSLWASLKWLMHGLLDEYSFTVLGVQDHEDEAVDCQFILWERN
eukprot:TRINITY_DN70782_c0_g1_i1.p1 TRINITY_DN70782_c0_g1~~TRINITY_DN70782_c0_g1_i1.p1  ORF type:complete len:188 (+),score=17.35 TRINITY_DN70782_c0_g1_i1:138-701(+)